MPKCVIVFKEKTPVKELLLKLKEAQTPILSCDLVEPLNIKTNSNEANQNSSTELLPNQVSFDTVKFLNPTLTRKDRQKTLATWLVPFGFIAGLSFSQMTGLETFAELGFPKQVETLLGGLLGMISGLIGSFFSAGGVNQDIDDDLRALRKKSEQGFWLLIVETPIEIDLPWNILKEIDNMEIITIAKD